MAQDIKLSIEKDTVTSKLALLRKKYPRVLWTRMNNTKEFWKKISIDDYFLLGRSKYPWVDPPDDNILTSRTGRLRKSIYSRIFPSNASDSSAKIIRDKGVEIAVGTKVPYARIHEESGVWPSGKTRPFLRPALKRIFPILMKKLEDDINELLNEQAPDVAK